MAGLLTELRAILRDVRGDDDLDLDAAMRFDGIAGWDPMDLVSVVVEVECRLGVMFEAVEIEQLYTIGDLMNVVVTKLALSAV